MVHLPNFMKEPEQHTRLPRSAWVIFVLLWGFVGGVFLASFVHMVPLVSILIIFLGMMVLLVEKIDKRAMSTEVMLVALALIALGCGTLRYAVKDFHSSDLPSQQGIVADEPEHRDTDTRFTYLADNGARALVSTDMYSHVAYGDRVQISCKFEVPGVITDDTGSFDYGAYLAREDIYSTCNFAKVDIISSGRGNPLKSFLFSIKNAFTSKMKAILPEPESSLLAGLTVAGKQALPSAVQNDFKNAGVVHIVVLSGYNITIIAEFFLIILGFLSLRRRVAASAFGIMLFVLMTGASATIVRAAIMAVIVLLGKVLHREYSVPRGLLLAGALMLLFNPKLLVFDPSFQLTFLAMLALIYAEPIVRRWMAKVQVPTLGREGKSRSLAPWLTSLLATTLATQLVVLPYLLYNNGSVSLVALVSNVLILVFVPLTMLIGFVATTLAFVSPYLALAFTLMSHVLLAWILGVAHILGNLSWASIQISHFNVWLTLLSYAVFVTIAWRSRVAQPGNSPRQPSS